MRAGYFTFRWWRKRQADRKQAEYLTKVRCTFSHQSLLDKASGALSRPPNKPPAFRKMQN